MTDRAKFEQMLEYLINEDKSKAEELFHELVVSKSREIYENLLDDDMQVDEESEKDEEDEDEDEDVEEGFDMGMDEIGGDPADDMMGDLEAGDDEIGDDDMMGDEGGDEAATKDDVMDIKDALEDLKSEFEAMLSGSLDRDGDGDHDMDDHDAEDDMDGDDMDGDDMDDKEKKEEYVREYVEKVAPAKMGDNGVNARSIVAGKNNMGGTTANLRGGESTKGGTAGGLANPSTKEDNAGNVNVPGAKKAATLSNVMSPKGGDNGANTKSTIGA